MQYEDFGDVEIGCALQCGDLCQFGEEIGHEEDEAVASSDFANGPKRLTAAY